jgi:hypothetical protein
MPHEYEAGHGHSGHHYQECIDACFSCAEICNMCGDDMIGMEPHGKKDVQALMARCIKLCRDCADICVLSAEWMSRRSSLAGKLCRVCAEVCDTCAETCEAHAPHHPMCGDCAKECRRCAGLCRSMEGVAVPANDA